MLTGRRAFKGEDVSETLATVLKDEPNWTALPATTPASIRSLLRRCLQKDPERRLRDIADARFQIEDALSEPLRPLTPPNRKSYERVVWVAGLIAVAAAVAGITRYLAPPDAGIADEVRFENTTPPTADPTSFAISPDGNKIVFEATSDGTSRLWLRKLDAVSVRPIAGTEGARRPFWSADSRLLGYSANGQVNAIDVETGTLQRLGHAGAWNHDGTVLFSLGGGNPIYGASAIGGEPTEVTQVLPGSDQVAPQFLPDGRHFLFTATGGPAPGVYAALLGSSEPARRIVDDAVVGAYSAKHLLFIRQGTLFAQRFDPTRLQLAGTVTTVADQIVNASGRSFALSASTAGPIAYRTGPPAQAQFAWFDRSGARLQSIAGSDTASFFNSSLSPDGRYLAIGRNVGGGAADIWLLDLRRGVPDRFTVDPAFDLAPVWSPDGLRIAYGSNKKGTVDLYVKSTDGTGMEDLLAGDEIGGPSDWSRDGRFILAARESGAEADIWAVPVKGDRKPFPVVQTKGSVESNGQFSPDGEWIAFQSNESGRLEIYLQPFPGPGRKTRISSDGGVQARWRDDGKELFFLAPDDRLMAVPLTLDSKSATVEIGTPVSLFAARLPALPSTTTHAQHYMVSPDGQRFLVQTAKEVTLPITVILNLKPRS
jgi:Tol biopolymer transport system component